MFQEFLVWATGFVLFYALVALHEHGARQGR